MAIRLVVADDHLLVREGLRRLLETQPDIEIAAVCEDLDSLLAAVAKERPDVVVTDIRMPPDGSDEGIRAAATLRETQPDVGVVILSQYTEPAYVLQLFDHGSDGRAYLLKERVHDRAELVAAIKAVADGGSVVDPKVVEVLVESRSRVEHSPLAELTAREREVLRAIAEGKSNAAIAEELVLTKRAVEKHVNAIFLKLGFTPTQESTGLSRRVKAALMFLADSDLPGPEGNGH
jgi:DNA-binding NarL/FixJ family response regulator